MFKLFKVITSPLKKSSYSRKGVLLSDNAKDDGLIDSPTKIRATSEMFPQWYHQRIFVLVFGYFLIKEKVRQR